MQIPLLHQQIILQTERLRDLHRNIMLHKQPVPSAEIDNLLKEIRSLYTLALQLSNENAIQLLNEIQLAAAQMVPEPVQTVQNFQQIQSDTPALTERKSQPAEKASEIPAAPIKESVLAAAKQASNGFHHVQTNSPTLATRFEDQPTLGERIAGTDVKKRLSDNLRVPVSDMKAAIGLNEKFQFINQLFNGDAEKYNSVIESINKSTSVESALNQIKDLASTSTWESHAASAKSFLDIIERRFSA